jgi:signal transduction histidine kinase
LNLHWLSGLSLRWRLTLFYSLGAVLILLAGSLALLFGLRLSVYRLLDQSLEQATQSLDRRFDGIERAPPFGGRQNASSASGSNTGLNAGLNTGSNTGSNLEPNSGKRPSPSRPRLPGDTSLSVFTSTGVADTDFDPIPVKAPLEPGARTLKGYRVFTKVMPDGHIVQATRSEADALGALQRTQELLWIGLPVLFLISLGAGYALADRALGPVDAVTRLAARIAANGQPGERVPESLGNDEMARLTRTVNAMLEKLEGLIAQEQAFALAAAHELRTPLAVLQGRVELSLERERTPEHYRESLSTVAATAQKLNRLVEGLLTLARSHAPITPIRLDLADIALEVAESYRAEAKTNGQWLELELESAPVLGDPESLRLAVSNLMRNAIKYGVQDGWIWLRSGTKSGQAMLEVCDDGPGVPNDDLERLRRPFQRGKGLQSVSGSGLGLALVNAVAEQNGGRLELSRAIEGGLCARIVMANTGLTARDQPAEPVHTDTVHSDPS